MPRHATEAALKNLKVIRDSERARELAKLAHASKKLKAQQKELLHADIGNTITEEMEVPESLYQSMKKYGIKVTRRERVDRVLFLRALMKAIKDGNVDPLLKIAAFAGFDADKGELKINNADGGNITVNILRMADNADNGNKC